MESSVSVSEALVRILVALLAGMLIGIEREKARAAAVRGLEGSGDRLGAVVKEFPGLRTFSLVAVYAASVSLLFSCGYIDAVVYAVLLAGFVVVVALFSFHRLVVARVVGVTTSTVLLLDVAIGVLAGLGEVVVAAAVAVLATFVLAIKIPVEKVVGRISYEELLWALELGVILVVLGPIFFSIEYSFYGVSPRSLYLFFALVLVASYMGYIAVRLRGGTGIAYVALLGGFAHSEATLAAVLQLVPESVRGRIAAHTTILSNTSMIIRDLAIVLAAVYAFYQQVDLAALAPLFLATLLASIPALYSWTAALKHAQRLPPTIVTNPLRFTTALKTTLVYLAIAITAYAVRSLYGRAGLVVVSLAGGLVSSSAIVLTLFTMGLPLRDAAGLTLYALLAAVLNKPLYAYIATGGRAETLGALGASLLQALLIAPVLAAIHML